MSGTCSMLMMLDHTVKMEDHQQIPLFWTEKLQT